MRCDILFSKFFQEENSRKMEQNLFKDFGDDDLGIEIIKYI